MTDYLKLMRPKQWVKNVLVFAPLFFAGALFDQGKLLATMVALVAFCLAASGVYALNDVADRADDALHPKKKHRPVASGVIAPSSALLFGIILEAVALVLSWQIGMPVLLLIAFYTLLNAAYSRYLKHVAILDIIVVSLCYVIRILVGGFAAEVPVSSWIVLCVLFGALLVVVGKRSSEFSRPDRRAVLESYSAPLLDHILTVSTSLVIVSYGLYSVLGHPDRPLAVYSIVPVLVGILRYMSVVHEAQGETQGDTKDSAETPEKLLFRDPLIFGSFAVWLLFMAFIFYHS